MTTMSESKKEPLAVILKRLEAIASWFDEQEEVDVEKALIKVREGAALIKESRTRLKDIENEFDIVRMELEREEESRDTMR